MSGSSFQPQHVPYFVLAKLSCDFMASTRNLLWVSLRSQTSVGSDSFVLLLCRVLGHPEDPLRGPSIFWIPFTLRQETFSFFQFQIVLHLFSYCFPIRFLSKTNCLKWFWLLENRNTLSTLRNGHHQVRTVAGKVGTEKLPLMVSALPPSRAQKLPSSASPSCLYSQWKWHSAVYSHDFRGVTGLCQVNIVTLIVTAMGKSWNYPDYGNKFPDDAAQLPWRITEREHVVNNKFCSHHLPFA